MKKTAVFIVLFLLFAGAVWGQAKFTWTGDGDGSSWEDKDNWKDEDDDPASTYPGESGSTNDIVIINNFSGTINISTAVNITIQDLEIDNSSDVTIATSDDFEVTGTLTNNGTLNFHGDKLSAGTLTNNDTLDIGGADLTAGTLSNNGNLILTGSGTQSVNKTTIAGTVTFNGTGTTFAGLTAFHNLTIQTGTRTGVGAITVSGNFNLTGGSLDATSIAVTKTSNIAGDVTTTGGAQIYTGAVTLSGTVGTKTLAAGTSTVTFKDTITGGNNSLAITGNGVFDGTVSGINNLSVSGTSTINADISSTGNQTYGAVTLGNDVTLTGATVSLGGVITGNNHSLTIDGAGVLNEVIDITNISVSGSATINKDIETIGTQTYGSVTLSDDIILTGATVSLGNVTGANHSLTIAGNGVLNGNINTGTGNQTYGAVTLGNDVTLTSTTGLVTLGNIIGATHSLTITGAGVFESAVSGINNLSVSGTSTINADISSTGTQIYTGAVTLGGSVTRRLTGTNITLGIVDGDTRSLTITGNAVFSGGSDINALSVSGTSTINGDITTSGNQTYTGTVTLGGTGTRTLTGATITLGAVTGNNHSLTIAGNGVFNGGSGITILTVNGTSIINAGITSTGTQDYKAAVTLGSTLTLAAGTSTVTFDGVINGGGNSLTITGNGTFNDSVSGINNLSVSGASGINADISTTGTQIYTGAVTLGGTGTRTLTGTTVTLGAVSGGSHPLTIAGDGVFTDAANTIGDLLVSKNFSLTGASLNAASINVTGTSSIAGNINTGAGTQTYGAVTLVGANATRALTGSTVTLGTIIGNGNSLTITGNGILSGGSGVGALSVSGDFALTGSALSAASVSVTGTSTINEDITTTGAQTYTGAATLSGGKRTITSQGGAISFGILNSSDIIELLASGGNIPANGNITLNGKTEAFQLIAIASGTVKFVEVETLSTGNEGANAAIYVEANAFDTSTAAANSIIPGGIGGQLCLMLKTAWTDNGAVDGPQDSVPPGTVSGARWHQHVVISLIGTGKHLVYGKDNPPVASPPTADSYIHIDPAINLQTTFVLDPNYSVYIYDASPNASSLTFETSGSGTINFVGTNTFKNITLKSAAAINIGSNVSATGTQTYSGTVILDGDRILTGSTVSLGAINGGGKSLTITGNGTFNGAVSGINVLSVTSTSAINADITTNGTQTYGAVTLGGTGDRTLTAGGTGVTLGAINGGGKSLTITGNGTFNGAVSGINVLSVTSTSAINADITTTGAQTYTGDVTLGGAGDRTLTAGGTGVTLGAINGGGKSLTIIGNGTFNGDVTSINNLSVSGTAALGTVKRTISSNGNIQFYNTLTSSNVIELSAANNITIGGAANAQRLIAKAAGTVSVNAITVTGNGNEGETAAIYIEANTFVVTTTAAGSIIPGQKTSSPWGQLCLNLQNQWTGPYDVVDGVEDDDEDIGSVSNARWHQHYPGSVAAGKILYSFTEDLNGNGKLDRIRAQTNKPILNGDFTDFHVTVNGYVIDTSKGTGGYQLVSTITSNTSDRDSFYIYLIERDELDGGNTPHWSITRNTSLKDTTGTPVNDISEIQYIDTIPPRIAYTLTLPEHTQTYVQMSEPVQGTVSASFSGTPFNAQSVLTAGYLFTSPSMPTYGVTDLVNLSISSGTAGKGYFQMTNITDNATAANPSGPAPKYPANWGYTAYAKSNGNPVSPNVFIPPHKLLPVNVMTNLSSVTPANINNTVTRRVTDVLISRLPATGDNYFVWPTFAKPQNDNKSISDFDGSKNLEKGPVEEGGIEMQVRLNSGLTATNPELFWTTASIPAYMRNPKEVSDTKKIGGLWLPNVLTPLYYYVPLSGGIKTISSGTPISAQNYRYNIPSSDLANSGAKFEFIFRLTSTSDMFVARLDAPSGTIPNNWYERVRPFGFNIQGMSLQRGGVTVMNNVINSDKRETAMIRYNLTRSGRVTIQIYTLDGTLVKSIRRNENREIGSYVDTWDGSNNGGKAVARGMYFVRVVGPDIDEIRKIMVVK